MITTLDAINTDLEFGVPKKNASHYSIHVSGTGTERIMIQSPMFELQANLDLTQDTYTDLICKHPEFIQALQGVDQVMVDIIKSKRDEWFPNKNIDDTFVEVGQVPSVIFKNVIRLRVNKNVELFDSKSKQKLDESFVPAGTSVKCIMHLTGLWFTATRWGITWNLVQMKTYPEKKSNKKSYTGYMFPDEDSDHDDSTDDIDSEPSPPPGV